MTHVKHCAAKVLHMISKDGIVAVVVSDSTETGRKSGNEIVVTVRKVTASENEQIF